MKKQRFTETQNTFDPKNNPIALFFLHMPNRETLYPLFLSKAVQLFK